MFGVRCPFTLAFLLLPALFLSVPTVHAASPAQTINIPDTGAVDDDEDTPDVTDRVARVSFVEGTAKVKRAESQDWETITLNLPLVEGDEIATDGASRLELQFGKDQYVRVAENSSLTIVTLRDDGIALSLSLGSATTHVGSFDKSKAFFEIDAPKSTLAIEKSGTFRVDAGQADARDVRVAAIDGGEAHVYSDNAGFALKNGRIATIAVDGQNAGEWQTADAATIKDEFDAWSAGRDLIIADKLKKAHYDTYYDDDIFGADDLDTYGEWVHTSQYGWVWRPDSSAISGYADWSPYRYGHWAWMPPFGWIWVNDEPWGWATYHHGRWVFDSGYWVWAPYPYYRPHRSWWLPALVTINIIDTNVCWYPLSYHHHYKWDYSGHRGHDDHDRWDHGRDVDQDAKNRYHGVPARDGGPTRDRGKLPPGSVVGVSKDEFSRGGRGIRPMPPEVAKTAVDREPPAGETLALVRDRDNVPPALRTEPPSREAQIERRRTEIGAATRKSGEELDRDLEKSRIFGGRTPKRVDRTPVPPSNGSTPPDKGRTTGVVDRSNDRGDHRGRDGGPVRDNGDSAKPVDKGAVDRGIRSMPPTRDDGTPKTDDSKEVKPRPEPPEPRSGPKTEPRGEPRNDPKTHSEPRSEPRSEPQSEPRSQPKSDPPARSEPKSSPATKSEPKSSPPSKSDAAAKKAKDQ